jgi:photosystem II stability/assembly factor-like uncharacterized protein
MKSAQKILVLFLLLFCSESTRADWVKQSSNTFAWLRDIYFLNEKTGWIAGSGGTLLTTDDGGKTWKKADSFTTDTIRQVYFTDESSGWLLCERNIYNRGSNSLSYLLTTTNGGGSWEKVEFAEEDDGRRAERIARIFFNESRGFAVGESGAFYVLPSEGEKKWKKQASPIRYLLLNGTFADKYHGVVVGAGGSILFTEDAGATWSQSTVVGDAKAKLNSVFFINQKTGWSAGEKGKVFQTVNGGKLWREQRTGTSKDLTDVFFTNTAEGWAVGDEGTILRTTTGGNVWTAENQKVRHKLEKIFFVGRKGWAVGFGGTILFYEREKTTENPAQKPTLKNKN